MKRLIEIAEEEQSTATVVQLTSVLEGLSSMRITQIKNQVVSSQKFFEELWHIYSQIRTVNQFRYGRSQTDEQVINKELFVVITAEGGFSGDIDQKLISLMLQHYNPDKHEIIVIGHHGAVQLAQNAIQFKKYYKMPSKDQNINTSPIIIDIQKYRDTTVYYQTYVSLMVQDVKSISLSKVVEGKGEDVVKSSEIISEKTYIFEPSTFAVVDHLERSMLQIAVSQLILESKLAQYASRFRAMSTAHTKADEAYGELRTLYNHAKRAQSDERLREIISGLRILGVNN